MSNFETVMINEFTAHNCPATVMTEVVLYADDIASARVAIAELAAKGIPARIIDEECQDVSRASIADDWGSVWIYAYTLDVWHTVANAISMETWYL
jgi:hypothetical protein